MRYTPVSLAFLRPPLRRFCPTWLLITSLSATLTCLACGARAQEPRSAFHTHKGFQAHLEAAPGMLIAVYRTPQGTIRVSLPDDLRQSENVVSTMQLKPQGKTDDMRAANLATLVTYHLVWGKQSQPVLEAPQTWTLPDGTQTEGEQLTLVDAQDQQLAQADLPVAAPPSPTPASSPDAATGVPTSEAGKDKIKLPKRGQAGRPLVLQVPAGSDMTAYEVRVGDKTAPFLAASPRHLIVALPDKVFGKTVLQLRQGNQLLTETPFRSDRVSHSFNPWPYLIGGGVVVGIMAIVIANDINNSLSHLGDNFHPF